MLLIHFLWLLPTVIGCPPSDCVTTVAPPGQTTDVITAVVAPAPPHARLGVSEPTGIAVAVSAPPSTPPATGGYVFAGPAAAYSTAWVKAGDIEPGGPWLGIQFSPVPKPLTSHLNLQDAGAQMVLNVITGSPADHAGFEQYDVILAIDGDEVSGDMEEFLDAVRGLEPGSTHEFSLIRGGKRTRAEVTVGTRPDDLGSVEYKYEAAPEATSEANVFGRSGLLEKDEQGQWKFRQFDLKGLPDVWKAFPGHDDEDSPFHTFMFDSGVPGQFYVHKSDKGESVMIKRGADDRITVTRTRVEKGQKTTETKTYADEDELKNQDPDAYEMLGKSGHTGVFSFGHKLPQFQWPPKGVDDQFMQQFEESMKQSKEAMKQYHEAMKQWRSGMKVLPAPGGDVDWSDIMPGGKPKTRFEVTSDGEIRVTTRDGGKELVESYADEKALKQARPELYRQFKKLRSGDNE